MYKCIILQLFALLCSVNAKCSNYIRHGDIVVLDGMCVSSSKNVSAIIGRKFCQGKKPIPAVFKILKDPWYTSECNYVISGRSALLTTVPGNMSCRVSTQDGIVRCDNVQSGARLRVLDKHGKDGVKLSIQDAYIKFRSGPGSLQPNADCSDGPYDADAGSDVLTALTCNKSPYGQTAHYGFFLSAIDNSAK